MKFTKDRIDVILEQLKKLINTQQILVPEWKVKDGCFIDVKEADEDSSEWRDFDGRTDRWFGTDAHYWFRTKVVVPDSFNKKNLWLDIHTQLDERDNCRNPQFLAFIDGKPVQGLDMRHQELFLTDSAEAGREYQVDLQAYTGTLHDEFKLMTYIEERSEEVKNLYYDIQVPMWGLIRMQENDQTYIKILNVLNETINVLDMRDVKSSVFITSVRAAREFIRIHLYENDELSGFEDVIATCIGHTHIDVAWLWTVAQVRQKSCRSFATVLKLMDEFPDYRFMSSQPQLYEFVKERHPEMYDRIKKRVAEGRWEPEGGMWVEADCNLTSGESLVRQFIFGKRFFKKEFGKDNVILWLPDVFGYSAALPQIMKKCGIKYFMTTKLAWNEYNKIPADTFWWEGIDGSRIFTHFITTSDLGQSADDFYTTYNGVLHPDAIMGGWDRYQQKDINNDILVSFGWGDGGGGPTREMLETSVRMEKGIKGIPKVRQEFARKYFDEVYDRVKDSRGLKSWIGELYFEFHRGTYTSMARNKKFNRKSEYRMMELELISLMAESKCEYPSKELFDMWKIILRNQFHDILPGSSIYEVYEVSKKEYEKILSESEKLIDERIDSLNDGGKGITVLNTLGFERSDIVNFGDLDAEALFDGQKTYVLQKTQDGTIGFIENVPSKGFKGLSIERCADKSGSSFTIDDTGIETPFYKILIDEFGQLSSIYDKDKERELLISGRVGNEIRVYEDKPRNFDNWNIDGYYQEKSWPVKDDCRQTWIENGPVRATLLVEKRMLDSTFKQKIHFYSCNRRIDFETEVDWNMSQHLCKVHFPLDIHTDEATFDIQFGNVKRKTHLNTSWDEARFESCGHKWADLSEGGYGVSLMNDCKYGYSVLDKSLSLTLIKAGIDPNETADIERHKFTYSLLPHEGDWKEGRTVDESFNINVPMRVADHGKQGETYSFMNVDKNNVVLETIKKAEDGNGVIVRIYEVENKRTKVRLNTAITVHKAVETDMLENEIYSNLKVIDEHNIEFEIKPYEVKTIRI